jgi:hypothetical protein
MGLTPASVNTVGQGIGLPFGSNLIFAALWIQSGRSVVDRPL